MKFFKGLTVIAFLFFATVILVKVFESEPRYHFRQVPFAFMEIKQ